MNVSRRDFAFTSVFALGASGLLVSAPASGQAAADEAAVKQNIETLRQGTQDGAWKLIARQGFRLPAQA